MRVRKWLVAIGVVLGVLLLVGSILFVALVYNPFEGSVESLDHLVPRDITLFTRKAGVGADIDGFPDTEFFRSLADSAAFKSFSDSPEWRDLDARFGLAESFRKLEDLRARLPVQVDFESNLYEVALAANPSAEGIPRSDFLLLARVSWKVCAAYNLIGTGFVRGRLDPAVELYSDEIGGFHEIHFRASGKTRSFFFARVKDVVGIANKPEIIRAFVDLGRGGAGLSLAFAEDYLRPSAAPGETTNALDLFFSLTRGAAELKIENFWEQFEGGLAPRIALEALGAKFLDRVDARVFFSNPPHARARATFRPEVRALHERRILTRPPLPVADVIARMGPFVPKSAFLFLFFRCDSRTVFDLVTTQIGASERRLVDDALAKTEFRNLPTFLDRTSAYFGDEIAVVLSRRDLAKMSFKDRAKPLPAATLLWRVTDAAGLEQHIRKIEGERFAVDEARAESFGGLELHTGLSKLDGSQIAYGLVGDVFVYSSAYDFAQEIAATHADPSTGLAAAPAFEEGIARLSDRANVLVYVDAGNFLDWLGDYTERWANDLTEITVPRFQELRAQFRREIESQYQGMNDNEIEARVDARIEEVVQRRKNVEIPMKVSQIGRYVAWARVIRAFGASLHSNGEEVETRAALQFEFE